MKEQNQLAADRRRKFLLVLPLLVLPFLTMIFWALGGGKGSEAQAQVKKEGLNTELPDASFGKEQQLDKMSYYDAAATDSVKLRELMKNDPYYNQTGTSRLSDSLPASNAAGYTRYENSGFKQAYTDPNEAKVYQKLEQLNAAINAPTIPSSSAAISGGSPVYGPESTQLDRLDQMMQAMNSAQPDPELQHINGMLESILDIQHPERVQQRLKQTSELNKGKVYAIARSKERIPVTTLEDTGKRAPEQNSFYSLNRVNVSGDVQNSVSAVVAEDQTIVSGSTVKLRLTDAIYVNGLLIPSGHFVYGIANLNGERLSIEIGAIRYGNSLLPVSLNTYDLDGLAGIYIPGAISRDVAKSSADRSIQSVGIAAVDPSLEVQAAGAGIEAAKSLLSRKVKLVKVMVKAGYQVLLKDEKQKDQN